MRLIYKLGMYEFIEDLLKSKHENLQAAVSIPTQHSPQELVGGSAWRGIN